MPDADADATATMVMVVSYYYGVDYDVPSREVGGQAMTNNYCHHHNNINIHYFSNTNNQ
jgi:hypothetical protein